ncbi:MAG: hypothetical protein JNM56_28180 [Planctomycetia bacterium]|nr:hypothetical protein [Planctomycetia bacterium]
MGKTCPEPARAAARVRVVELPDNLPAPTKRPEKEDHTATPWWADVELAPAAKPVFAELVFDERPVCRRPVHVPLVAGSVVAALVLVATMVWAAWHLKQHAAASAEAPPPVIVAAAPQPVKLPGPVASAPVVEEPPAVEPKPDPQLEARLAELERLKEVVAKFERRTEELEKEAAQRTQQAALAPARAAEPKGCYGTSVHFADGPTEAAEEALKDKKLLLILTISGNFEEAKFT